MGFAGTLRDGIAVTLDGLLKKKQHPDPEIVLLREAMDTALDRMYVGGYNDGVQAERVRAERERIARLHEGK